MKPMLTLALVATLGAVAGDSRASETVIHVISTPEFLAGTSDGVTVDLAGRILRGPALTRRAELEEPIVWCAAVSRKGRVFVGTGHDGKVLDLGDGGHGAPRVFFDADEIEVTALLDDGKEGLYAGTSPDGKVYHVDGDGNASVLFEPSDRYIWALARDGASLLVGTGSQAAVYRVASDGQGELLWTAGEHNVTSLLGASGAIYVGTDDGGKLYRIAADGAAFAIWDSTLKEIASLASDGAGNLYAAAVDLGRPAPSPPSPPPAGSPGSPPEEGGTPSVKVTVGLPTPPPQTSGRGQTEVVRVTIAGDAPGTVETIWEARDEPVTRILWRDGALLLASLAAPGGRLLRHDGASHVAVLARLDEGQPTALLALPGGATLVCGSNPGSVHELGAGSLGHARLTGPVIDAGAVARFGVLRYVGHGSAADQIAITLRSGNTAEPGPGWTPWSAPVADGEAVPGPLARYLEWRVDLTGGDDQPWIERIALTSLQENLPPVLDAVAFLDPGIVYKTAPRGGDPTTAGTPDDHDLFAQNLPELVEPLSYPATRRLEWKRGMRTLRWSARDPNGDRLTYRIAYRRDDDGATAPFLPMKESIDDDWYTFDTTSLPDGRYRLELVASDAPSNPRGWAREANIRTQSFDVDNTPPKVSASSHRDGLTVVATDGSALFRAYASVGSGPWVPIRPEDGITDGRRETYHLTRADLGVAEGSQPLVLLKVFDRAGNVGADSVRLPAR